MRPALQKLLARPSSLRLLRYMIQQSSIEDAMKKSLGCQHIYRPHLRNEAHTEAAVPVYKVHNSETDDVGYPADKQSLVHVLEAGELQHGSIGAMDQPRDLLPSDILGEKNIPTVLLEGPWTSDDIDFESDLAQESSNRQRLVDKPEFRHDLKLWAYLLDFRKRRYGDEGVEMFWNAVRTHKLQLPTEGRLAITFWTYFLDLGFKKEKVLLEVFNYAKQLYGATGKSWSKLYVYIIQRLILDGKTDAINSWHSRLIRLNSPGPATFSRLVRNIVYMRGDLKALEMVYTKNKHQKVYAKVIPLLLSQQDYQNAFKWHFLMMRQGDYPSSQKIVESLIQYYAVYSPRKAVRIARSLVKAGVSFASNFSTDLPEKKKISREMMNLLHGEAFHIEEKKYNDTLGARWFATRWISLDLAINTVHALGVETIGPLSLQAIALREGNPEGTVRRIDQLQELGISIGQTLFARAVESFAREPQAEFLQGLLESDQHPDSLEDWKFQESLLAAYARDGDTVSYRRTIAIRLIGSTNPRAEQHNIKLRLHVEKGDRTAILRTIEEMRMAHIAVTQTSISYILRKALAPRRQGHAPITTSQNLMNLETTISILTDIMKFNSFVPVTSWNEIIRHLGMLGWLDDLDRLCLWLAAWYRPDSTIRVQNAVPGPPIALTSDRQLPPVPVQISHYLHPLGILFPDPLQRAIVEWGFKYTPYHARIHLKYSLPASSSTSLANRRDIEAHPYTRGIRLLKLLQNEGVHVSVPLMRRALFTRLAILYGPGETASIRNRILKQHHTLSLQEMVVQINRAWGGKLLPGREILQKRLDVAVERGLRLQGRRGRGPYRGLPIAYSYV